MMTLQNYIKIKICEFAQLTLKDPYFRITKYLFLFKDAYNHKLYVYIHICELIITGIYYFANCKFKYKYQSI